MHVDTYNILYTQSYKASNTSYLKWEQMTLVAKYKVVVS